MKDLFVCFVGFYDFLFLLLSKPFLIPGKKEKKIIKSPFRSEEVGKSWSSSSTSECKKQKDNPHFDDSDHSSQIDDKCIGFYSLACQLPRQQVAVWLSLYTILPLSLLPVPFHCPVDKFWRTILGINSVSLSRMEWRVCEMRGKYVFKIRVSGMK